jgi:DNA-binding response OmpR family regulator
LDVSIAGSMTGLDVCRALRAAAATAGIPMLMLSGWAF